MHSMATREAAAVAEAAREAWRDHRRSCVKCERAARSRNPREMCDRGRVFNQNRAEAEAELRRNRTADARTDPNQGELIALSEFRKAVT